MLKMLVTWLVATALAVGCPAALADPVGDVLAPRIAAGAAPTELLASARAAVAIPVAMRSMPTHDVARLDAGSPAFAAALPEPTTIALLAIALLAIVAILRVTRGRKGRHQRRHQPPVPPA